MIKRFSSFVNEGTFIPHLFTDFTDSIGETNIFIGKTRRKIKAPGKYPLPGSPCSYLLIRAPDAVFSDPISDRYHSIFSHTAVAV